MKKLRSAGKSFLPTRIWRETVPCLLAAAALLCFPILAQDDDNEPSVTSAVMGFNTLVPVGKWTTISVLLKNPGSDATGFIDLESLGSEGTSSRLFTRHVFLPGGCTRLVRYPVRFEAGGPIQQRNDSDPLKYLIRLTVSDIVVDTNNFYYRPMDPYPQTIIGIDEYGGRYNVAETAYLKQFGREIQTVGWTPRDAPMRVQEYLTADAVILGEFADMSLNSLQQRALIDWVEGGGLLIFSPGKNHSRFDGALLEELLPVRITGMRKANRIDCLDRFGAKFSPEKPIHVLESVNMDGEILLSENGFPIVVKKNAGLGTVIFVAADMTDDLLRKWKGFEEFFTYLIDRPSQMLPYEDKLMAPKVNEILNSFAGIKVPQRTSIIIYLIAVMAAVLLPPLILRKYGREGLGWGISLAASLVFTIGASVTAKSLKGIEEVSTNEVFFTKMISGSNKGKCSGVAGIISPSREYFDITAGSHSIVLDPMTTGGSQGMFTVFETSFEDSFAANRFLVNEDSMRSLTFSGPKNLNGTVESSCAFTDRGIMVTVKNGLSHPLLDGFFKYNRLVINVPDAAPGEEVTAEFGESSGPAETPVYSRHTLAGREGVIRNQLRKCFFPDPIADIGKMGMSLMTMRTIPRFSGAGYFGWSDHSSRSISVSGSETNRAIGLIGVRTPVKIEGGRVLVPRGVCSLKMPEKMAVGSRTGEVMTGLFPADLAVEFGLPRNCEGLRADKIKIFWDFRSKTVNAAIFIGRPGKNGIEYVDIGEDEAVIVPGPERFLDGTNSTVYVSVKMTGSTPQPGTDIRLVDSSWQLWGLDVEIEGSVTDDQY